jgi:tRNA/tmRNA/rRNA uracil-C5-methylase (TrmA/RlmC/RlmD family)
MPNVPDVLPNMGKMTWARAMGIAACEATCKYLRDVTGARVVVDPFCGVGTMLAVANAYGFDAIGVELSAKRAAMARELNVSVAPK